MSGAVVGKIRGLLRAYSDGLSAAGYPQEVSGSPNTVSIVCEQSMVDPPSDPSAEGGGNHVSFVGALPEDHRTSS